MTFTTDAPPASGPAVPTAPAGPSAGQAPDGVRDVPVPGARELERQLRTLRIANSLLLGIAMAALLVAILAFARTGTTSDEVSMLSGDVSRTEAQLVALDGRAATLRADLDGRAADLAERADEFDSRLADLRHELDEVAATAGDDVAMLQTEFDELAAAIAELTALIAELQGELPVSR